MTLCDVGRLTRSDFLTGCGMADLSMACYEDGGALLLCDVGRLTRSDFLNRWDGWPVDGLLRRWRVYDPDVGRLTNQPDRMPTFRDAMLRVFSPIGFNINFTLNTWFWIRIYRIMRIKNNVFVSEVKVNWRCMSMMVVSWCSASHCGVALPSS